MSRINPLESDQANGKPQQSPEEDFNDNQENDKTKILFWHCSYSLFIDIFDFFQHVVLMTLY